ncbi:PREDICTED: uncharacterized protein LOC101313379 [Fragaria vesca subsp. vesca]|uniref:uncharacterized protein LOC101313379 n=1 Tax=Fragaria vesca subsp. vesca TaxID=101020 RepID=UPI0002C31B84|nr:PREDICTED: uncharacterized protein LOC101313379 [Fragaria vesca subsp. vesca]
MGGSDVTASTHDIENPLETLKMKLTGLSRLSPLRCIHRVPDRFRRERERDYTPRVISIGPYHHGKEALKRMEVQKMWYLNGFMNRPRNHSELNDYIEKIREQEVKLRNYYTETIVLDSDQFEPSKEKSDQFVTMVLVDAIFLLEFLLRCSDKSLQDENDCIFGTPWMLPDVATDLLMLENQLPLFILEDLFSLYNDEPCERAKQQLSIKFLSSQHLMGYELNNSLGSQVEGQHFVDLLRNLLLIAPLLKKKEKEESKGKTDTAIASQVKEKEESKEETDTAIAPTIERLHQAGVKFINGDQSIKAGDINGDQSSGGGAAGAQSIKAGDIIGDQSSGGGAAGAQSIADLFDITFNKHGILKNGILKIPKLRIDDRTELILRNIIAYEQCSISNDRIISDYVILMDMLIDSPRDVELLVKNNIIKNDLGGGDKDVANMINGLSTGIIYNSDNFYYAGLCGDLDTYCSSRRHKWIAKLRRDYCLNPWSTISVVAAVVLLILTAIQTICAVYQLFD